MADQQDTGRALASLQECVKAAESLYAYTVDKVVPALEGLQPTRLQNLLLAFLMRGMTTFEAMVVLGSQGFGEQTAMLNRSLFEQMLDAHWLADNETEGRAMLRDHERLTRAEFAAGAERFPDHLPAPTDTIDLPKGDELKALRKKFGAAGMSWTGVKFKDRVKAVMANWPEIGREAFAFFADIPYKIDNLWLHPSPFAMKASVEHQGDHLSFTYGPNGFYVEQALFAGSWSLAQLVTLVLQRCEPQSMTSEQFEKKAYAPACARFFKLSNQETEKIGRNDPCPCESGLKFKYCHGR